MSDEERMPIPHMTIPRMRIPRAKINRMPIPHADIPRAGYTSVHFIRETKYAQRVPQTPPTTTDGVYSAILDIEVKRTEQLMRDMLFGTPGDGTGYRPSVPSPVARYLADDPDILEGEIVPDPLLALPERTDT